MNGADWSAWRRRLGYTQDALMRELGIRSRQTIITWEKADEVPRLAELALYAIENVPDCRGAKMTGSPARRRWQALRGATAEIPVSAATTPPQKIAEAKKRLRLRRAESRNE